MKMVRLTSSGGVVYQSLPDINCRLSDSANSILTNDVQSREDLISSIFPKSFNKGTSRRFSHCGVNVNSFDRFLVILSLNFAADSGNFE